VERLELERVRQRQRVGGHVAHLVGAFRVERLPHVAVVEDHGAEVLRPGGHLERPGEVVGAEAHHAEEWLAFALLLVVDTPARRVRERHVERV
jgi:hypothetical protein